MDNRKYDDKRCQGLSESQYNNINLYKGILEETYEDADAEVERINVYAKLIKYLYPYYFYFHYYYKINV